MKSFLDFISENDDDWNITAYHGTPDARNIHKEGFKTSKQRFGHEDHNSVYWATDSHKVAKSYADPHRASDYQNSEPAVLRVQMRMKNPKHISWGGKKFHHQKSDGTWDHVDNHIAAARKAGHDGVVIHNVVDNYHADHKKGSTVYATFHPHNIRVAK